MRVIITDEFMDQLADFFDQQDILGRFGVSFVSFVDMSQTGVWQKQYAHRV